MLLVDALATWEIYTSISRALPRTRSPLVLARTRQRSRNVAVVAIVLNSQRKQYLCTSFIPCRHEYQNSTSLSSTDNRKSSFYGICPTTDPDQLGLGSVLNAMTTFESTMGASCSSIISSIDCAAKWGVYSPYKGQYPDPAVGLPPNGTELLSTTSGPLTSPPGGATYTWSLLGSVMTATAAPYNEKNVEATSSEGVTATSTKSGGTAATSMASGTATTTLGSTKSSSTKATSTAGSNGSSTVGSSESSTSSAAATSASKTSRAAKVQSIASLDYAIFALLTIAAYIS